PGGPVKLVTMILATVMGSTAMAGQTLICQSKPEVLLSKARAGLVGFLKAQPGQQIAVSGESSGDELKSFLFALHMTNFAIKVIEKEVQTIVIDLGQDGKGTT